MMQALPALPQPVIARVDGVATAAGCPARRELRSGRRLERGALRDLGHQPRPLLRHARRRRDEEPRSQGRLRAAVHRSSSHQSTFGGVKPLHGQPGGSGGASRRMVHLSYGASGGFLLSAAGLARCASAPTASADRPRPWTAGPGRVAHHPTRVAGVRGRPERARAASDGSSAKNRQHPTMRSGWTGSR